MSSEFGAHDSCRPVDAVVKWRAVLRIAALMRDRTCYCRRVFEIDHVAKAACYFVA